MIIYDKSPLRKPPYSNIYLMNVVGTDVFKIGYTSNDPNKRKYGVKYYVGNTSLIDYVFTETKYESILHNIFKEKKVDNGFREFFRLSNDDIDWILKFFSLINIFEPSTNG